MINSKELMIMGALSMLHSFPAAIELLKDPKLRLDPIISHEFPLEDIHKGFEMMRNKEAVKVVVYPK